MVRGQPHFVLIGGVCLAEELAASVQPHDRVGGAVERGEAEPVRRHGGDGRRDGTADVLVLGAGAGRGLSAVQALGLSVIDGDVEAGLVNLHYGEVGFHRSELGDQADEDLLELDGGGLGHDVGPRIWVGKGGKYGGGGAHWARREAAAAGGGQMALNTKYVVAWVLLITN